MIPDFIKGRRLYFAPKLDEAVYQDMDRSEVKDWNKANLVSSQLDQETEMHMPVLDIDFPAHLEPSTTYGHFHLYLDKPITWPQYRRLLSALHSAGIIERGFCKLSIKRGASFVRRPGVRKGIRSNDI